MVISVMKSVELVEYDVVRTDGDHTVIRRADGRVAQAPTGWFVIEEGKARAAGQVKQLRIDGLEWRKER